MQSLGLLGDTPGLVREVKRGEISFLRHDKGSLQDAGVGVRENTMLGSPGEGKTSVQRKLVRRGVAY